MPTFLAAWVALGGTCTQECGHCRPGGLLHGPIFIRFGGREPAILKHAATAAYLLLPERGFRRAPHRTPGDTYKLHARRPARGQARRPIRSARRWLPVGGYG